MSGKTDGRRVNKEDGTEMALVLQPCDWVECDVKGAYRVDVFGRTSTGKVACLQITGFKPYFYVGGTTPPPLAEVYEKANKKLTFKGGPRAGQEDYGFLVYPNLIAENTKPTLVKNQKYDVFAGFNELTPVQVWRATCPSLATFQAARSVWSNRQLYESNLPPFLRLFHDRHLGPASPLRADKATLLDEIPTNRDGDPVYAVDEVWTADYRDLTAHETSIALLVGCYDLEMYSESGKFPQAERGDPIIQIGISYRWSTNLLKPSRRVVFVLGTVDEPEEEDVEYISCATGKELLEEFVAEVMEVNPDVLCGYNIFGFDDAYLETRAAKLGVPFDLSRKLPEFGQKAFETKKFELASGKYDLRFMTLRGRLGLDLLLNMRREHSLDSFKLDNVASVFLRDKVLGLEGTLVHTKSTRGLSVGNYVRFDVVGNTTDPYREGEKFIVTEVTPKAFRIRAPEALFTDLTEKERKSLEWTFSKDDVDAQDLFRMHKGKPADRATIAKYCLQDCDLVLTLMAKLDTLVNARGMADVCKVPMDYVLRRGQGIKIFSAVLYYASQRDQILRVQEAIEGDTGYEGAIVLPPKIGMYLDQPVSVLDFNSLYPSNMIAYNLSPDTLVSMRVYNEDGQLTLCEGYEKKEFARLEEAGYVLDEVEYDHAGGKTVCTYVQASNEDTVGILPKTLDILLKKRKEFKEKMEDTQYDEAQRSVFNGLQLAYKVVANSVYGQTGSRTSPIRKLCVAACTTAAGRKALFTAKRIAETEYGAEVVYGDTDSIFIKFPTKDLAESIRLGMDAGKRITSAINRRPYKIAYEKTFYPFILFCRKRYVGMMYEDDPTIKPKRKSMGIVLKRRDNAPIVKDVFGGALDVLMQERNVKKAQAFVTEMLSKVLENKVPLEKFIVTKALRDDYKNPDQIAHRVLADRMAARDPGTAPKVGDRIAYIYVAENKTATKQGDKIEELSYVRKKGLHPDTQFYITNQIQNPVAQLFALCLEDLEGYTPPRKPSYGTMMEEMLKKHEGDEEEATLAVLEKKERQLETLMFLGSPPLQKLLRKNRSGPLDAFFGKKA
jgi:DNA polymerase elongation subunit (family B)